MKNRKAKALVYLYTGTGAGKTTAALGACMRAVGHNLRVVVVQFMKGRKDIGEYKIQEKLKPYYEIYQFGRPEFVDLKNPSRKDINLAQKGLEFIEKEILKNPPYLLVLDEINMAAAIGLVNVKQVLKLLDKIPSKTTVFLTGRFAPAEFIARADTATEMVMIKHVLEKGGIPAKKGIQY